MQCAYTLCREEAALEARQEGAHASGEGTRTAAPRQQRSAIAARRLVPQCCVLEAQREPAGEAGGEDSALNQFALALAFPIAQAVTSALSLGLALAFTSIASLARLQVFSRYSLSCTRSCGLGRLDVLSKLLFWLVQLSLLPSVTHRTLKPTPTSAGSQPPPRRLKSRVSQPTRHAAHDERGAIVVKTTNNSSINESVIAIHLLS